MDDLRDSSVSPGEMTEHDETDDTSSVHVEFDSGVDGAMRKISTLSFITKSPAIDDCVRRLLSCGVDEISIYDFQRDLVEDLVEKFSLYPYDEQLAHMILHKHAKAYAGYLFDKNCVFDCEAAIREAIGAALEGRDVDRFGGVDLDKAVMLAARNILRDAFYDLGKAVLSICRQNGLLGLNS